jgi:glycosyltransferase involved in cell wall biosynthesis
MPKKIVMYIFGVGGGAGKNFLRLAQWLSKDVDVDFVYSRTSYVLPSISRVGFKKIKAKYVWASIFNVLGVVGRREVDVVVSTVLQANIISGLCCILFRKRFVCRETGVISAYLRDRTRLATVLYGCLVKYVYGRASAVICISHDIADDLNYVFGVDSEKLVVIGNPAYEESFDVSAGDYSFFPDDLKDKRYVLIVGRLEKEKRFEDAFVAFKKVAELYDALVVVGDGSLKDDLSELARELGVFDKVKWIGLVENPMPYYKFASVLILPSEREGFGNVVVEALSQGCNVIVSSCPGGPKDIVDYGAYGKVCAVGDVDEIAESLKDTSWMKANEVLRLRAKEYSLAHILSRYSEVILNES